MSRLDSFIRRMTAQRAAIDWAAAALADMPGDVLEIGLGNGRTYDHLREKLPNRKIWVIERKVNSHPKSTPPAERMLLGEADDHLKALAGRDFALMNYDLGEGVEKDDVALAAYFTPMIRAALRPGGILVSAQPHPDMELLPDPAEATPRRSFIYRRSAS